MMQDQELVFGIYTYEDVIEQHKIMSFDEGFQQGQEKGADYTFRELFGKMTQKGLSEGELCDLLDLDVIQALKISFNLFANDDVIAQHKIMSFDEGFQQGQKEGADNTFRKLIRKMMRKELSEEKICDLLDLTPEKIKELLASEVHKHSPA